MNLDEIKNIVDKAFKLGASEAEVYYLINDVFTVRMANKMIIEAKGVIDEGIAIRILTNDNGLGFAATSKIDNNSIEMAIRRAIKIASKRKLKFKYNLPKPEKYSPAKEIYDEKLANISRNDAIDLAYRALSSAENYSNKITDISGTLNIIKYTIRIVNSNGIMAEDKSTLLEGVIATTAKEGGVESEGYESIMCKYLSDYNPESIGTESAKMAIDGLKAKKLDEGIYTAILAPRASADIAIRIGVFSNPIIAKSIYQFFLGKEGEKVASEKLTVLDDPRMPRAPFSCSIDDEGVPTKTKILIDHGIFKGFYYDSISAAMENKTSTGNGFRPPGPAGFTRLPGKLYISEPTANPSNLVIKPGKTDPEELIRNVKNGVLIKHLHYARISNRVTGDYTAVLRMGLYKIENGEIKYALKKSRILDNILSIINNVEEVGNDLKVAGLWGRYAIAPSIKISKLRVVPL